MLTHFLGPLLFRFFVQLIAFALSFLADIAAVFRRASALRRFARIVDLPAGFISALPKI